MSSEIYFDGSRFISANDAARTVGVTRDYIGRLCRDGKLSGKRVGKLWYVDENSLNRFLIEKEHSTATRREKLSKERSEEYKKKSQPTHTTSSVGNSIPITVAPAPKDELDTAVKRKSKIIPQDSNTTERARRVKEMIERGVHSMNDTAKQASTHAAGTIVHAAPMHHVADIGQRVTALFVAFALVFGTYGFVDAQYARFAKESILNSFEYTKEAPAKIAHAFTDINFDEAASQFASASASMASNPAAAASSFTSHISQTIGNVAKEVNDYVDTFVYEIVFTPEVRFAIETVSGPQRNASVEVSVIPSLNDTSSEAGAAIVQTTQTTGPTTIIEQPVVERLVTTERVVTQGGVSESDLLFRLNTLDNKLTSQINALSASIPSFSGPAQSTVVTTQAFAQSNKIDQLNGVDITGGTISNATISGGSVTATSFDGTLGISSGGTGTTTAPSYGQVLLGQSDGTYDLVATSSLGISGGGSSFGYLFPSNATTTGLGIYASTTIGAGAQATGLTISGGATTTGNLIVQGTGTSTFSGGLSSTALNITSNSATSTFANGIQLTGGCFLDSSGTCVGGSSGDSFAWSVTGYGVSTTTIVGFENGFLSSASSTISDLYVTNSTTTNATTTNFAITSLTNSVLATDASGRVVATTSLHSGATGQVGYFSDTNTLTGTSSLFIANTGYVGINSQVPGAPLHVVSDISKPAASTNGILRFETSTGSDDRAAKIGAVAGSGSSGYVYFQGIRPGIGNDSNLILNPIAGNVGIGDTSPSSLLTIGDGDLFQVNSSGAIAAATGITSSGTITFSDVGTNMLASINASGNLVATSTPQVASITATSTDTNTFPTLLSTNATTTSFAVTGVTSSLLKTGADGSVVAAVAGTDYADFAYLFPSNATSTLLEFNGGLTSYASSTIGAGTQTTGLTISGGATTTGNVYIAGDVGIGTANPTERFVVNETTDARVARFTGGSGSNDLGVVFESNNKEWTLWNTDNIAGQGFGIYDDTLNAYRLVVDGTDGNIGIGTTTPGTLLSLGNTGNSTINISASATSTFGSGIDLRSGCFSINGECVGGDGGGSGGDSFAWTSTGYGVSTSTTLGLLNGFLSSASSTISDLHVTNSTTTNATTTNLAISNLTNALLSTNANGSVIATSTLGINLIPDNFLRNDVDDSTSGSVTATEFIANDASATSTFAGGLTVDTSDFVVDPDAGRVGIGTANPYKGLHVQQGGTSLLTSAFGDGLLFSTDNNSGARIFLENLDGAVDQKTLAIVNENVDDVGSTYFGVLSDNGSSWVHNYPFLINHDTGYVGLGTSSPYARLSVVGETVAEYFTATSTGTNTFPTLVSTNATTTNFAISNLANTLLSANANGSVVATSSIGSSLITGSLGTINGTTLNRGDSITVTAASSTLLSDNNTFSGLINLTNATATQLSLTDLFISGDQITDFAGTGLTVSGTSLTADLGTDIAASEIADGDHGDFTYSSGSATLDTNSVGDNEIDYSEVTLADFTNDAGFSTFSYLFPSNATSTLLEFNGGLTSYASSTIGAGTQTTGLTISGGATTTGNQYIAGNTTIGTTTGYSNLSVWGGASGNIFEAVTSASSSALIVNSDGNVGIGTTTPDSKLHVRGSDAAPIIVERPFASANVGIEFRNDSDSWFIGQGGTTGNFHIDGDANLASGPRFTVTTDGNVGIGTTTPGTLLSLGNTGNSTINISASATSTFGSGIDLRSGCFSINGECVGGDSGPSGDSFAWSTTGYGVSTSTTIGFTNGLLSTASSTFTSSLRLSNLSAGGLAIGSGGLVYSAATTTAGTGLTYTGSAFNVDLGTDIAASEIADGDHGDFTYSSGSATLDTNSVGDNEIDYSEVTLADFTNDAGFSTFSYLFPSNATSTLLEFNGGLTSYASSTIGAGTQTTGLTISGGATTTGTLIVQGTATSTFSGGLQAMALNITSTSATSTFANGIDLSDGCFSVSGTCLSSGGTSVWTENGSDIYYNSGSVGIGTTTPGAALHVLNTSEQARFGYDESNYHSLTAASDGGVEWLGQGSDADLNINVSDGLGDFSVNGDDLFVDSSSGNIGLGTTTPFRRLSVFNTVSTAQAAIAYDNTRYTDFLTDATGDFVLDPSGGDAFLNDDNLWVCTGGSCPSGTPSGTGNLIVENKLGVGTTTPFGILSVENPGSAGPSFVVADASQNTDLIVTADGDVGVGTTTPTEQLSVTNQLFVGAGGASGLGTATSTFQGDIRITGKLDVGTIDPVYSIDGTKYATYGHSSIGVKEEVAVKFEMKEYDWTKLKYKHVIDFSTLEEGSDLWLFHQITDYGNSWENLVVSLTPAFDGRVYYEEDNLANTITIYSSKRGSVSARLVANRYDSAEWPNIRTDQEDPFTNHVIERKGQ